MTKLTWNDFGKRFFEVGVDRGVLYTSDGSGVAWNGLKSVSESPSGGEPTGYYLDGFQYLNRLSPEDFNGTIEAYTYPDEFEENDGSAFVGEGLLVNQQVRKEFDFSYRTFLGNDLEGTDLGYKLHIVYRALAKPVQKTYSSLGDTPAPTPFSWEFSTTPTKTLLGDNLAPLSHITIDSTKAPPTVLFLIEEWLYGVTDTLAGSPASIIPIDRIISWFENPPSILLIIPSPEDGLNTLVDNAIGDFIGNREEGLYRQRYTSRLVETDRPGLYTLTGVEVPSDLVTALVYPST